MRRRLLRMDCTVFLTAVVNFGSRPTCLRIGDGAAKALMAEIDKRTMQTIVCDAEYVLGNAAVRMRVSLNPAHVVAIEWPN